MDMLTIFIYNLVFTHCKFAHTKPYICLVAKAVFNIVTCGLSFYAKSLKPHGSQAIETLFYFQKSKFINTNI